MCCFSFKMQFLFMADDHSQSSVHRGAKNVPMYWIRDDLSMDVGLSSY